MMKLSFTLFLLVSCAAGQNPAVTPGTESESPKAVSIDAAPVDTRTPAVTPVVDLEPAPSLETPATASEAPLAGTPDTAASREDPAPSVELPAVKLQSVRVCDNQGRKTTDPMYFKVRVATYSDGVTEIEIKLRKDTYTLIDTKVESAPEDGNFYLPMGDEAKMFFGYGQVQPVYANPLFRIEMFQNEKNLPLLFIFASKFASGSQYQGVGQPISGMICTNFKGE